MSHVVKVVGRVALSGAYGGVAVGGAVGGSALVIPLTPILIGAGIVAGTVVMVSFLNNRRKEQTAKSRSGNDASKTNKIQKVQLKGGEDTFYIQSLAGDFCSVEGDSDCRVTCNRKCVQDWETFRIMRADDGRVAFQGANERFVSIDWNRAGLLVANQKEITDSSLFTMQERGDSFITLQSKDGRFVSRRQDDNTLLKASADSAREWELFRFMIMKDQITISETINITKTISVNIDITNYSEIVKHHKGWFLGGIINTVSKVLPEKWTWQEKKVIRDSVRNQLTEKLKSRIEEAVSAELSSRLGKEVSLGISDELATQKIKATVVTSVI